MTSPVLDEQKQLRSVEDLIHPTNDERFGIVGEKKEDVQFAVSKSDLMGLLRGETLIRGPLRRTLTLSDGPFVIVEDEDGEPIERVKAPEPIEFMRPDPEPVPVEEPDLRERISTTLRNFVDGVMDFIRRDPEVQRHGKHVGQEGREGAKGGSQPGFTHENGIKESFVSKIGEALQKNARHVITLDVLDQVREGRGWLSPDGILTTNFGPHDTSAAEALDEFGIEYSGNPQSELLALGFARLILSNRDIAFGGSKKLTYPQARFMAFLLDKDSTRPVFVDYYDNDGQYTESADKGKGREALGKLVDQGYRLVGKSWVPNSGVARHGKHVGQEGREGEAGGSAPGFTHADGKDEEDDRGSFEPREGLFHGTTIEAAKGIMENGLKVDFADDNNMKDGVVYATEDWFRALIFGHQSPGTTFGIVFFDPNKMGSKPEVDELGSFLYSEDVPPEAITKIELYELGESGQPDDLIKTIERAEEKSEQFIAVGFADDGSYSIMGNQQNQADVARHGEEHISQEGREGEKGGSQPGYTHGEGGDGSGEPQNGKSEGRRFTGDLQEEAHEWASTAFVGAKAFNDGSVESLIDYKNYDAYEVLNEALRDQYEPLFENSEQLAKLRDTIDEAMEISTIPEDLVLYRGMSTDRLNRMAGEGKDFVDNSYVSTSLTPFETKTYASNKDRPSILEIHAPKGTSGIYMENFNEILLNEEEVLLDRGLKFRFVSDKPRVVFGTGGTSRDYEVWEVEIVGK